MSVVFRRDMPSDDPVFERIHHVLTEVRLDKGRTPDALVFNPCVVDPELAGGELPASIFGVPLVIDSAVPPGTIEAREYRVLGRFEL